MKKWIAVATLIGTAGLSSALAAEQPIHHGGHHYEADVTDARISLGLSPQMKQHQFANMRGHVEAIRTIVGLSRRTSLTMHPEQHTPSSA